jgi:hypothetical protein
LVSELFDDRHAAGLLSGQTRAVIRGLSDRRERRASWPLRPSDFGLQISPRRCLRRGRYFVPGFGPRACSPLGFRISASAAAALPWPETHRTLAGNAP